MPRPQIDAEVVDRLTDAVDARTKVPAEHLGIEERLTFLLDELEDVDRRADYLGSRVDTLEDELEEARQEDTDDDALDFGTGGVGGVNPNDRL